MIRMKRYGFSVLVFLFLLVPTVSIHGSEKVDAPTLEEGERWEFKASTTDSISSSTSTLNGIYEVAYHAGQLEVFAVENGAKRPIGGDGADELKRMILPDEQKYFKFPLAAGNKWTGKYFHVGSRLWRSMDYLIAAIETVTVTAGTFRAYRIDGNGVTFSRSGTRYEQKRIIHYSLDARCIVKFFYDSAIGQAGAKLEIELTKKFSPPARDSVKAD